MTDDTTRQGDWERKRVEGEGQDPNNPQGHDVDQATGERWNKEQWVGEGQGSDDRTPQDPDTMLEGESELSGDRNVGGESHFARGQAADERNA
jgi:hypothetical protein